MKHFGKTNFVAKLECHFFRFIENPAILAGWDLNYYSVWLIMVRIKNKIRDKMSGPSSFIFASWVKLHVTFFFFYLWMLVFKLPFLKRGLQDLLLLHGLVVTSCDLSMPFELQKSNIWKTGSRCLLKDYNLIFFASEPFYFLFLLIITRQSRRRARGNMTSYFRRVLKIRKYFWEILDQSVKDLLRRLHGYIKKLSKFILILKCVLGLRNCLEMSQPLPPTCIERRPHKHEKSLPLFNCKYEREFRRENS